MKRNLKFIIGLIALIVLTVLIVQLINAPTDMLSSSYMAGILIVALLIGSLVIAGIIKLIFKRTSFFIVLCSVVSILSLVFIFKLFSPTLTIIVPKGYEGQISLILSDVDKNILTVDSNGIGYIDKQTFDKVYTKPIVLETDGADISSQCVGYSPSTFWSRGTSSSATNTGKNVGGKIDFLSFEVVPKDKRGQKQYYDTDLINLVDKKKLSGEDQ